MQISTGLRDKLLDTGALRTLLNLGFIKIYSGAAPASADDAATGTLLCTVSNASTVTGLTFNVAASAGTISKNSAETWSGVNAATGTAGYFRFVSSADTGVLSTTEARIQGTIGLAGTDLVLSSTALTVGATQTVDYFVVAMPAV